MKSIKVFLSSFSNCYRWGSVEDWLSLFKQRQFHNEFSPSWRHQFPALFLRRINSTLLSKELCPLDPRWKSQRGDEHMGKCPSCLTTIGKRRLCLGWEIPFGTFLCRHYLFISTLSTLTSAHYRVCIVADSRAIKIIHWSSSHFDVNLIYERKFVLWLRDSH